MTGHADEGFVLTGPATPLAQLLRDVWRTRRLLVVLAKKDFYVRYRRTSLGVLWAVGVTLLGFFLGKTVPNIDRYLLPAVAVIVVLSLVPIAIELLRARRRAL